MGLGSILGAVGTTAAGIGGAIVGGPAGAGAAMAGAGAIAGAFSSGGSTTQSSGYTLPPELELQMLQQFNNTQSGLMQYRDQIGSALTALQNKLQTLNGVIEGTLPSSEATKMLTQHNADLANSLGISADEMVKNGFMTEADAKTLNQMRDLSGAQIYEDPQLKNQLQDQRRQLDQQLAQQGASPAMRAQALSQFDRQAQEQMFSRSQELKVSQSNLLSNTLQSSLGARQQGFNQALQGYQTGQSQLGFVQQTANQLGQLGQAGFGAAMQGAQAGSTLSNNMFQNYQNLGQFKFSKNAKNLLGSGVIGPGSIYGQTGIPGSESGAYNRYVSSANKNAFKGANPGLYQSNNSLNGFALLGGGFGGGFGGAIMNALRQRQNQASNVNYSPTNNWQTIV